MGNNKLLLLIEGINKGLISKEEEQELLDLAVKEELKGGLKE